jgi:hypothetical protein
MGKNKQGFQMVYLHPKNPNLGTFWRALEWKILAHFMAIWYFLRISGIFYYHVLHFVALWYILPHFGLLCREKSGNPELKSSNQFLRLEMLRFQAARDNLQQGCQMVCFQTKNPNMSRF